jgi:hypothetical protein
LIPTKIKKGRIPLILEAAQPFQRFLSEYGNLSTEIERWERLWIDQDVKPSNFYDLFCSFSAARQDYYPNIYQLVFIMVTIPASTATPERSFSTMRRVLTEYRTTSTGPRISDLVVIATYKQKALQYTMNKELLEELVTEFANSGDRRLRLK